MGIVSRISDIFAANLNALLDRAEDPEVMLDHMIRVMEDGLDRARRYTAVAIAAERRLRRDRDDNCTRGEQWRARAREALAVGREDLARRALTRSQEHDALSRCLDAEHAAAAQAAESARRALVALEERLTAARHKQRVLLARHRTAQVRVEVSRHLGAGRTDFGGSEVCFDRLADRLTQRVEELVAEAELRDHSGLEAEFIDVERRLALDRELEAMKRESSGGAS